MKEKKQVDISIIGNGEQIIIRFKDGTLRKITSDTIEIEDGRQLNYMKLFEAITSVENNQKKKKGNEAYRTVSFFQ
jgi:hypothetical protein